MSDPMYDRRIVELTDKLATMKMLYRAHCASATAGFLLQEELTPRAFVISIGRLEQDIDKLLRGK